MATNRASYPETYLSAPSASPRVSRIDTPDGDAPRRMAMVAGGAIVALISLAIGSIAPSTPG